MNNKEKLELFKKVVDNAHKNYKEPGETKYSQKALELSGVIKKSFCKDYMGPVNEIIQLILDEPMPPIRGARSNVFPYLIIRQKTGGCLFILYETNSTFGVISSKGGRTSLNKTTLDDGWGPDYRIANQNEIDDFFRQIEQNSNFDYNILSFTEAMVIHK